MKTSDDIRPWLFAVEPLQGESLSHFLGRIRRRNHLTSGGLGELAGIGAKIARWERFYFNPFPSDSDIRALGEVVGIDGERLRSMLPPLGEKMRFNSIRLCGDCYSESPCHRIEWQFESVWMCEKHALILLSKCPQCDKKFKIPASWEFGECDRCRLSFPNMGPYQKKAR